MDKNQIAFYDIPELQKEWKPKVGDKVYLKSHHETTTVINADTFNKHPQHVLIPSIEDMFELMTSEKWSTVWANNMQRVMTLIWINRWYEDTSPVDGYIKAYMHVEHDQTFDGEKWV